MIAAIINAVVSEYLAIMNPSLLCMASLADLSVIRVTGADAADFLHGQLTQDIAGIVLGHARLAGYCTPKGRLLATLIIWRDPVQTEDFLALVKADIAQALVKRLSMFVLRAKVKLVIEPHTILGVSQPANAVAASSPAGVEIGAAQPLVPPQQGAPWSVHSSSQGTWVVAPCADAESQRWWLVCSPASPFTNDAATQPLAAWQAADIAAGLPWIEAATQDLFIPQTLNLDLIEGVHFTKGCYPGQEVVARSHYRGTIKRRTAYGVAATEQSAPPAAGSDIFDASQPESPCGRIVNAAAHGQQVYMLLEVHLAELDTAKYRLGSPEGAAIEIHALPYPIDSAQAS